MESVPLGCCDYMVHNEASMDALPNLNLWETESFDSTMAVELHDDDDCYQTPIWPTEPLDFQEDHLDPDEDDLLFSGGESAMMVLHDRLILDKAISANFNSGDLEMSQIQFNSTGFTEEEESCNNNSIKKEPQSPDRESRKRCFPMPQRTVEVKNVARRIPSLIPATTTAPNAASAPVNASVARQSGNFVLPPTPPSSTSSSDTECCSREEATASPDGSEAGASETESVASSSTSSSRRSIQQGPSNSRGTSKSNNDYSGGSIRHPINSPLISYQPKGSTGTLQLTEEEKRTLLSEGYPVPTRLPLTKAEEKSLKKIRRKIKNKISAQESRRKKKEYMDTLERRSQILADENADYQVKLRQLEMDNAELQAQVERLQQQLQHKDESQFQSALLTSYTK